MPFKLILLGIVITIVSSGDIVIADPETVDGLLKRSNDPGVIEPSNLAPKIGPDRGQQVLVHPAGRFHPDTFGRSFQHQQKGKQPAVAFGSFLQQQLGFDVPRQQPGPEVKRWREAQPGLAPVQTLHGFTTPPVNFGEVRKIEQNGFNYRGPLQQGLAQNVFHQSVQAPISTGQPKFKYLLPRTTGPSGPPTETTTKAALSEPRTTSAEIESTSNVAEDKNSTTERIEPVAAMLQQDAFSSDDGSSLVSIFIGVVFVAIFVVGGVGLVLQSVVLRMKRKPKQNVEFARSTKPVRSPKSEDLTPPELRACGQPTFIQPDISPNGHVTSPSGSSVNGKGGPGFIGGKLIFHDPPGNYLRSDGTRHLPPSSLGAVPKQKMMLPIRAAVTDDLMSQKFEDDLLNTETSEDDDDDDDENSDDTVYECPGLARGGIVVSNPFFAETEFSSLPPPIEAVKAEVPRNGFQNNNNTERKLSY